MVEKLSVCFTFSFKSGGIQLVASASQRIGDSGMQREGAGECPGHPPGLLCGDGHHIRQLILKDNCGCSGGEHPIKKLHCSWHRESTSLCMPLTNLEPTPGLGVCSWPTPWFGCMLVANALIWVYHRGKRQSVGPTAVP